MRQDHYGDEIFGTVRSVIYQNDENGYAVLRLDRYEGDEIVVVGHIPFVSPGESLALTGSWVNHPTHGRQFQAGLAERSMPDSIETIGEYLSSGAVKGIGPATAVLIVSRFGLKSLEVLENNPEKLASIRGISMNKALGMSESFRRQMGLRRLMEFLAKYGLKTQYAIPLYRYFGGMALTLLRENPYILISEQIGAAFSEADRVALEIGFDFDSQERISAAILFELEYNLNNGHCFIPRNKLGAATASLIGVDAEDVDIILDELIADRKVIPDEIAGEDGCYLSRLYQAEGQVAKRVLAMAKVGCQPELDIEKLVSVLQSEQGIVYAALQREALRTAASSQIMALTGGPGTGKTTTVRAMLALFDKMGLKTVLAAPTGRAAKRMEDLSGREASTIHRLLEANFAPGGEGVFFRKDAEDPLDTDVVILDECSMVDIMLMNALLEATPEGSRLVLVGDADQLPPVGPGNVFLDILRSGVVRSVRLTEVFRQNEESRIIKNAHRINQGQLPDLEENRGDFFFLRRNDPDRAVETIIELCGSRLPDNMGIPACEIQVLSPTRLYDTGTQNLNLRLQEALNPALQGKNEKEFGKITFREGDRVMQIRNNYDIIWRNTSGEASGAGVFNGDTGQIVGIDETNGQVTVLFDDKAAVYGYDMLGELEHAFAMTVHKSQGSEYRAVILAALSGSPFLMSRGVLYTAVSRAREILVIVGDDGIISRMVHNDKQQKRYSGLRARLCSGVSQN